jgi:hypothetical protein
MGPVVFEVYVPTYFYHEVFGYTLYPKEEGAIFRVKIKMVREISGCRDKADDNCALLRYCAACSSNLLPTFRDNKSFPSSRIKIQDKEAFIQYHIIIFVSTILQRYFTFIEA